MEAAVRILLVEDEKKVAKAFQEGLEHEGYSIRVGHTGEDGFYLISSEPFDLIILDVMLTGRSGLGILSTARANGLRTPVLILTALDTVEDRVVGLNSGADDYLVKPFAFPQLQARLRALLRRGKNEPVTKRRSGGLELDNALVQSVAGETAAAFAASGAKGDRVGCSAPRRFGRKACQAASARRDGPRSRTGEVD